MDHVTTLCLITVLAYYHYRNSKRKKPRIQSQVTVESLPRPENSDWMILFNSRKDAAFMDQMGVNVKGFFKLLKRFKEHYFVHNPSIRGGRPSKISQYQALGLVLQFYRNKIELKTLAIMHGLPASTACRTLRNAEMALNFALRSEPLADIKFPSKELQIVWSQKVNEAYPNIQGRFGFVDGKNCSVKVSSNDSVQNAQYNGWLHDHFVTGVLCFGVDGTLIWYNHNCPGSWNDGDMSLPLQELLSNNEFVNEGFGLVSDSAFPAMEGGKIISPLKENELQRVHPAARRAMLTLSNEILSLRQACEWGVGSIEKVWRQFQIPMPLSPHLRNLRMQNMFHLWNFRVRTTGITQIGNVFLSPS